jgi:hypothetical protein
MYSPAGQQRIGDFTAWEASQSTTTITDPNLVSDTTLPDGDADLEVTFTSIQAPQYGPQPGQTCDQWDLDYILVPSSNGSWLVDIALPHSGSGYVPC